MNVECSVSANLRAPHHPELEPGSAFANATIDHPPGSKVRLVQFRGGELRYDDEEQLVLSMGLTASHALEYATGRTRADVVPLIGRFGLMTPGQAFRVTLRGDCRVLQLVMPRSLLLDWIAEDHEVVRERVEIAWGHTLDDPTISRLLCAARAAGPADEAPYLRALVARLFGRFSPQARASCSTRGGLPAHKIKRVIELIEDCPGRSFSVDDLAREVSISPYHFAHQFRHSIGRAPHRFMVEKRVSRAVELLGETSLSIAEIAVGCGFTHASHLSRHFHRVLGQSPAQFREAIRL